MVLVADCCHAGTLLRGGDGGVRWRSLRPDLLGIPPGPPRRGGPAADVRAMAGDSRGIVALYAAGSDERAPEQPMPRSDAGARWHGLLSYTVASELARAPVGVTWRGIATGCAAAYRALPCHGASPLAEGDLDRPARLGETRAAVDPSLVVVSRDGARIVAAGGVLAGLLPGVVLEEAGPPSGARARRFRVASSDAFAAVLEPVTPADAPMPAEGTGPLPSLRVVERPAPDLRLGLAVVDAEGRPLDADTLPADLAAVLRAPDVAARFPLTPAAADAAWLLVRGADGAYGLRPAVLAGGDDAPFRADAASLPGTLAQVFRVENLRRLASTGLVPALDPALHVDLARAGETEAPSPADRLALVPGDRVRITIRNETGRAWDLWLFALDASYGVSCVFPAPGDAPRLTADDRGPIPIEATVTDETLGEEALLVVAVPPVAGALPADLRWLEAPPLARPTTLGARGRGSGGALGALLEEAAFGSGLTAGRTARRGVTSDAAAGALALRTWRTAWPAAQAPASFPGATEDLAASPPPPPPVPPTSPAPSDLPDLRPAGRRGPSRDPDPTCPRRTCSSWGTTVRARCASLSARRPRARRPRARHLPRPRGVSLRGGAPHRVLRRRRRRRVRPGARRSRRGSRGGRPLHPARRRLEGRARRERPLAAGGVLRDDPGRRGARARGGGVAVPAAMRRRAMERGETRGDGRGRTRRALGMGGARGAGARVGVVGLLAATVLACRGPLGGGCGGDPCEPCEPCARPAVVAPAPDAPVALRPDEAELLALVDGLFRVASPAFDPEQVARAKDLVANVEAAGRLRAVIDRFLARATAGSPVWSQRAKHADRVVGFIRAQLCLQGRLPACRGIAPEPFADMARRHEALLAGSGVPRAERTLAHPGVESELGDRGGAPFVAAEDVEVLIDGPASWRRRIAMLEGAKERISCLTWAFYDDTTGWDGARRLVAAAKRGVRVRVCVDAQVAEGSLYAAPVRWLVAQAASGALPLEIVAWRDPARPFDGQHRKILVVDGRAAVLGGMNFGDAYSHLPRSAEFEAKATAPAGPGWRDTDLHVGGDAAVEAERVFAWVWNEQIATRKLPLAPMDVRTAPARAEAAAEGVRAAVVEQRPDRGERTILLSWLTAIDAAATSVEVTNAYLVRIPSVQAALLAAAKRGVRVRVLTNSEESLDEPILATAILTTVGELVDGGVEVHLRKGSTLHAKTLVVDDTFCSVGSFNLLRARTSRGRGDRQPPREGPRRRAAGRLRAGSRGVDPRALVEGPGPPRRPPRPPGLGLLPRPPLTSPLPRRRALRV